MKSGIFNFALLATGIGVCTPTVGDNDGNGFRSNDVLSAFEEHARPEAAVNFTFGEHTMSRIIETQTMFIRHTATEYQRRVAERNAKVFFSQLPPAKKVELKKKHIHAVLIRTVPSKETTPGTNDVRMRVSLEGESLIDNYAYEFQTPLQAGTIAKLKGLEPEFVGQ